MNNNLKKYRIADVFDLPVRQDSDGDIDIGADEFIFGSTNSESEQMGFVAHAINTHDAMQDRIAELKQERDQLKAQNDDLLNFLTNAELVKKENGNLFYWNGASYDPLPGGDVCLADIQAKAIEEFQAYFDAEYYGEELSQFIEEYADRLNHIRVGVR